MKRSSLLATVTVGVYLYLPVLHCFDTWTGPGQESSLAGLELIPLVIALGSIGWHARWIALLVHTVSMAASTVLLYLLIEANGDSGTNQSIDSGSWASYLMLFVVVYGSPLLVGSSVGWIYRSPAEPDIGATAIVTSEDEGAQSRR